jgi:hypothetical protein
MFVRGHRVHSNFFRRRCGGSERHASDCHRCYRDRNRYSIPYSLDRGQFNIGYVESIGSRKLFVGTGCIRLAGGIQSGGAGHEQESASCTTLGIRSRRHGGLLFVAASGGHVCLSVLQNGSKRSERSATAGICGGPVKNCCGRERRVDGRICRGHDDCGQSDAGAGRHQSGDSEQSDLHKERNDDLQHR